MKLSGPVCSLLTVGVVLGALATPTATHAQDAPDTVTAATQQLVSQVLTLKQLNRLGLTQVQLRDIIQRLSTFTHAQELFAAHQVDAARPVLEPLRKIKAAMQAGDVPDPAEQGEVDTALAGLRTEQVHVESLRRETITAIRQILTRTQLNILRTSMGLENGGGPRSAGNGAVNGFPAPPGNFGYTPAPEAPGGAPAGELPAAPPAPAIPGQFIAPGLPPPGPEVRIQRSSTSAAPVLIQQADVAPDQLGNAANALADQVQQTVLAAFQEAPPAATPAPVGVEVAGEPGGQGEVEARMQRLEAQMAKIEAILNKVVPNVPRGGADTFGGGFGAGGGFGGAGGGQPQMTYRVMAGTAFGNGYAFGGNIDDDVVARFFLQAEMLRYLRARAAK